MQHHQPYFVFHPEEPVPILYRVMTRLRAGRRVYRKPCERKTRPAFGVVEPHHRPGKEGVGAIINLAQQLFLPTFVTNIHYDLPS